ncbi:Putative aliphatic sulfonates-binding protein [Methylobacterium crusticola]|uniref:Aliphatic sulfonates-binding protein n=1 Tax=Methylobacterium crusticola TaxID=1697972 RepID=A0ABQ4R1S8_9HYPH|nr:aliphatic sulfonate ABC transporter substrate-binding protein [Methylobacterium crusticola]GJD51404.1 Putative aliphatic sulfonates-binding protein [Methylobacterium crusticola]
MTALTRRGFARLGAAALALGLRPARAEGSPKELRIGFQKAGLPVVARRQGPIEARLAGQGRSVRWVEFTAGPPLLEAMNVGAVDVGWTGDAPPIFAQAAGAAIVYVAALPSNGAGEAVIVKPGSPVAALADLRGRKVGFTKGSSSHNLTVAALERAGVPYQDITPVYLSPADAAAAFARDAIDAWTIWDPFLAIAQQRHQPRLLATSRDVLDVKTYFLANKGFAAANPDTLRAVLAGLAEAAAWANGHRGEVAATLAEVTGVDLAAQTLAANRTEFGIEPITEAIVAGQQATADRFHRLGLIPRAIAVREAVWTPRQS